MTFRLTVAFLAAGAVLLGSTDKQRIEVAVSSSRVAPGETVIVTMHVPASGDVLKTSPNAILLKPSIGVRSLPLQRVAGSIPFTYTASIHLPQSAPPGLYVVHAWTGDRDRPSSVGKATFLSGKIIGDFFIASALDEQNPRTDLQNYLQQFRALGGNFLIAHNLITSEGAYFPCAICKRAISSRQPDIVELLLAEADRGGYAVLLSVSWDITRDTFYQGRMKETLAIMDDLYSRYAQHPSLAGFYSFQEGSGTYYVPYIREFSKHVKSLNPHLLAACAPYVDDPLLAGYLGTLKDLDIIIWQSGVMASYRPDNRKKYPLRRVKDFCSLAVGAKQLESKIALTHVELFGYLEQLLAPDVPTTGYNNIYQQILSAASVADSDGIMLFTYHYHIYNVLKKHSQVGESRKAVVDGLNAFNLIASRVSSKPNPLAFYFPYSDWVIERWPNSFLPALDAFRVLGIAVDVLPYTPPLEEAILPYYPVHMNRNVLARLLKEKTVLILPDISGFQQTDSDLIEAFVEQGGAVVAFGPEIPMGRSYQRTELFGGEESQTHVHSAVVLSKALGNRVTAGSRFALPDVALSSWTAKGGRPFATFEDGSAAIIVNSYGKGKIVTIVPSASTAAQRFPELVRDAIDYALASAGAERAADVLGANERMDTAIDKTSEGFAAAVINHNAEEMEITIRSIKPHLDSRVAWIDLITEKVLPSSEGQSLKLRVPARAFRAVELRSAFR